MATKEQIAERQKLVEEVKTEIKKEYEEKHVTKEEYDKLLKRVYPVPISCPECDHKFKVEIRPKKKEKKKE